LSIPPGWLCYLPPEVMQKLRAGNQMEMDLPFSQASDIYAFGFVTLIFFYRKNHDKASMCVVLILLVNRCLVLLLKRYYLPNAVGGPTCPICHLSQNRL
jgi:hypothetical protein